jgi:hypothetical protein
MTATLGSTEGRPGFPSEFLFNTLLSLYHDRGRI